MSLNLLDEKVGVDRAKFVPAHDQKQVVVTILQLKFQSQPCQTIHHTNGDRLEGCPLLKNSPPNMTQSQGAVVMVVKDRFQHQFCCVMVVRN
eukprot:scaffold19215_cov55-Cyclotella_meneghiniana.AAC.2